MPKGRLWAHRRERVLFYAEQSKRLGVNEINGLYVNEVLPGGGAAQAGLKEGDIITKVDGNQILSPSDLQERIGRLGPGDKVQLLEQNNRAHQPLVHENLHELEASIYGKPLNVVGFLSAFAKPNLYSNQNYNDWFYPLAMAPYALLQQGQRYIVFQRHYYTSLHNDHDHLD